MKHTKHLLAVAVSLAITSPAAFATNGMNMEGYGPIATGMGGASMAYDNGTAATMNNPATLSLMEDGNRLDLAVGVLSPSIDASHPMPASWSSSSNSFLMPAAGWVQKKGKLSFGAAAFAQGGMGTEYKNGGPGTSFVQGAILGAGDDPTIVSGWREFSEVGVARVLFPVSYVVDNKLSIGGSIDYVRATMDLQMALPGTVMGDMMMNPNSTVGSISMSGAAAASLPATIYGGYFDFADSNDYAGKTEGDGFAAKIGFTYKVNEQLTIGGTYHSETSLSDLSGSATMALAYDDGGTGAVMSMPGKIKVKDFQWPQTFAVGMSYKPNEKLMVVADIKQIKWSEVMKDFKMSFVTTGLNLDATMYQNWDDQTVISLGVAYQTTNELVLRAGANMASNPIPTSTVHYLFPATIENHYTLGLGYTVTPDDEINFSVTHAPEVSVTGSNASSNQGLKINHAQTNWQLMYSHSF